MPWRHDGTGTRSRPARRSRPRRPTRWRPGLDCAGTAHPLERGQPGRLLGGRADDPALIRDLPGQLGRDQPRDRGGRRDLVGRRLPLEGRGPRRHRHAPGQPAGCVDDPGSGRELHPGRRLHRPRRRLGRLLPALRRRFRRRPGRVRRVRQRPRRTDQPRRLILQTPRPDRHRRDGAEHRRHRQYRRLVDGQEPGDRRRLRLLVRLVLPVNQRDLRPIRHLRHQLLPLRLPGRGGQPVVQHDDQPAERAGRLVLSAGRRRRLQLRVRVRRDQ